MIGGRTPEPEWVDLGLPSGTLWRKSNIGAERPQDVGLYFSWGNLDGHTYDDGYDFSDEQYNQTPGSAVDSDLTLEHDAAYHNLGENWRIPSSAEFNELITQCDHVFTQFDGVKGLMFTSRVNGKTLFLVASGIWSGTQRFGFNVHGDYWTSTYVDATHARSAYLASDNVSPANSYLRSRGFNIRPVVNGEPNRSVVPPVPEE